MGTITRTLVFYVECCCNCGISFALELEHRRELVKTHNWFYCPNGHRQHYAGETDAEKHLRWYQEEQQRRCRAEYRANTAQASLRATRGVATKRANQLRQVQQGKCPHCGQVFKNLRRHMHRMHDGAREE